MTAGIDFGLVVASILCGEETAKLIQLLLEYNPAPPFDAGSPEKAGEIAQKVKQLGAPIITASFAATQQAAAQLAIGAKAVN